MKKKSKSGICCCNWCWCLRRYLWAPRASSPRCSASGRYKFEPIGDDLEVGYPTVLVQIPMYNEKQVYKLSIEAACGLSWLLDRLIIQVLDDSKDPEIKLEDWEEEEDGEWTAPTIPNPEYKGPRKQKKIKNPNYKGKWKAPMIDYPDLCRAELGFANLQLLGFVIRELLWSFICLHECIRNSHRLRCLRNPLLPKLQISQYWTQLSKIAYFSRVVEQQHI